MNVVLGVDEGWNMMQDRSCSGWMEIQMSTTSRTQEINNFRIKDPTLHHNCVQLVKEPSANEENF